MVRMITELSPLHEGTGKIIQGRSALSAALEAISQRASALTGIWLSNFGDIAPPLPEAVRERFVRLPSTDLGRWKPHALKARD
jgi:hypothetical protein